MISKRQNCWKFSFAITEKKSKYYCFYFLYLVLKMQSGARERLTKSLQILQTPNFWAVV